MNKHFFSFCFLLACILFVGCQPTEKQAGFKLEYEKFVLDNGLEVVFHEDHSDPIVAVAIQYHVGSNREKPGKTGFAHFFEHMLFQRSENLKRNEFFSKIDNLGGTFNGGTWKDGTIYYEVVPNDALETILWMESDRMGFFINTVTQQGLEREIDVVINEKRQMVDNLPYGHTDGVIHKALYPHGHPYSWTVIGEIADLQGATVEDVKEFYHHFYAPNNATLVLAGNFDRVKTKEWIEKYFGEINSRDEVEKPAVQRAQLDKEIRLFHEDKYANMPELTMTFSTPEMYHKDSYALDVLVRLLTHSKKAPLYKAVVEEAKLAPSVNMSNDPMELAGELSLTVRAFPGTSLDEVYAAIQKGMQDFETNGINPEDLQRIINLNETSYYQGLSSVMLKSFQIALANVFGGSPDMIAYELEQMNAVTADDVMRVFNTYLKGKPSVITSFVPMGQTNLALSGSTVAEVTEEALDNQAMKSEAGAIQDDDYLRTPSNFDRSIEPERGVLSTIPQPQIWNASFSNGMKAYGIEQHELPLVYFNIVIPVGTASDPDDKAGLANLTAQLLREGTANKTTEELEDAIRNLGASLSVSAGSTTTTISGNCLSRNVAAMAALVEEILLYPRWDEKEFERLKQQNITQLEERKVQPNAIASEVFNKLLLGDNGFTRPRLGTIEALQTITLQDIRQFYADYFASANSNLLITGSINRAETEKAFASLAQNWNITPAKVAQLPTLSEPAKGGNIYFVDYPDAKQSVIMLGKRAMNRLDPSFYPAEIANYKLGDGSGSELFRILRLERGYTYGAYSFFIASENFGTYLATSGVQTTVTKESIELFHDIISNYGENYTEEILRTTCNALLRKQGGQFETIYSLIGLLNDIVITGLPADYVQQNEQILRNITLEQTKEIITKELNFDDMIIVVVGDAKSQFPRLKEMNIGFQLHNWELTK